MSNVSGDSLVKGSIGIKVSSNSSVRGSISDVSSDSFTQVSSKVSGDSTSRVSSKSYLYIFVRGSLSQISNDSFVRGSISNV